MYLVYKYFLLKITELTFQINNLLLNGMKYVIIVAELDGFTRVVEKVSELKKVIFNDFYRKWIKLNSLINYSQQ